MRRIRMKIVSCAFLALGVGFTTALHSTQANQSNEAQVKTVSPQSQSVIAGEAEAKKLLLLMDTDKNGKVSRAEFMAFMAAEFDRLDVNKDGELDVKELSKSSLTVVHRGGVRR